MSQSQKFYIIAGEASGDMHAANLMKAFLKEDSTIDFRYWGGDSMQNVQQGLVKHIKDLAFMGFIEVFMNLKTILGNISFCKKDISEYKPDALILVDYPGFNLRIAEWAKKEGIKVYFYISPQVWAWKQSRVHKIKKVVDKMFVILPFEKEFYKKFDYEVEYVGHPLLDEIERFNVEDKIDKLDFVQKHNLSDKPILAVLPGSREQEVSRKLPIMLDAVKSNTSHQIVIAGAPSLFPEFYQQFIPDDAKIIYNETYNLLSNTDIAVVTSGTATLETALFEVPEVVCYKGSNISYQIAKKLIKIKYISLVNLIMDKEVVLELIQNECNSVRIKAEVDRLINDSEYRNQMTHNYQLLKEKLGGGGASEKVAQSLLKTIRQ